MKHALQVKDIKPTLYEVMGDDIPTFSPDPKDLDLATAIRPGLQPSPEDGDNIFTDGEVTYYCVEVERETPRTIASSRLVTAKVWCRTTWRYMSGGYWEPPEIEEQPLDEGGCWASLSDAARATAHDVLDREIDALDNTCYECYGCGKESPLDESGGDCKNATARDIYLPQKLIMETKMKNEIDSLRDEIRRKEKEAKAKVKPPTFDELFAYTPEGDFHWESEPEDVGNVWWCGGRDCETGVHQDCQYIDMGRENGKTWFVVYLDTIAGCVDYQPVGGWDEREGSEITESILSGLRFDLEFRTIEHFASWANYHLDCAITGEDPLENWFDSSKNTPENNIAAAKDNLKYLTK